MKITLNKFFALGMMAIGLSFASCEKPESPAELGDAGSNFVKLANSGESLLAFDPLNTPQEQVILDVRRDVTSNANLNKTHNVVIKLDQALLDAYNEDHNSNYEFLPAGLYNTVPATSGNVINLAFGAGEFAKPVQFILPDASKMDFTKQYAMAYTIESVDGDGKVAASNQAIVKVLVKNQYDGAYEVTGTMEDLANPALTGLFPMEYHLITSGQTKVDGFDPIYWGSYFIPIYSGADVSGYGSFSPVFTFDEETNKITSVVNRYGQPAGNTRSAELDPSGENFYDAATKTIKVKFFMKQPSVVPDAPNIRVKFDWTMKRTGDR